MDSISVKLINRVAIIEELNQKDTLIKVFKDIIKYRELQVNNYNYLVNNQKTQNNNLKDIINKLEVINTNKKRRYRKRLIYSFGVGLCAGLIILN
tara:strand:- start:12164 stop:12448 length:285 start_codon:yes stop_codon:yes gene_type:complete